MRDEAWEERHVACAAGGWRDLDDSESFWKSCADASALHGGVVKLVMRTVIPTSLQTLYTLTPLGTKHAIVCHVVWYCQQVKCCWLFLASYVKMLGTTRSFEKCHVIIRLLCLFSAGCHGTRHSQRMTSQYDLPIVTRRVVATSQYVTAELRRGRTLHVKITST